MNPTLKPLLGISIATLGATFVPCESARAEDLNFEPPYPVMDGIAETPIAAPAVAVPLKSLCVQLESGVDVECVESAASELAVPETSAAWTKKSYDSDEKALALLAGLICLIGGTLIGDKLARDEVKDAIKSVAAVLQNAADAIDGALETSEDIHKACNSYRQLRHLNGVFKKYGLSEFGDAFQAEFLSCAEVELREKIAAKFQALKADKTRGPDASELYATLHPEEHIYWQCPM